MQMRSVGKSTAICLTLVCECSLIASVGFILKITSFANLQHISPVAEISSQKWTVATETGVVDADIKASKLSAYFTKHLKDVSFLDEVAPEKTNEL